MNKRISTVFTVNLYKIVPVILCSCFIAADLTGRELNQENAAAGSGGTAAAPAPNVPDKKDLKPKDANTEPVKYIIWEAKNGKKLKAAYVSSDRTFLTVRKEDGKTVKIHLANLSEKSRNRIFDIILEQDVRIKLISVNLINDNTPGMWLISAFKTRYEAAIELSPGKSDVAFTLSADNIVLLLKGKPITCMGFMRVKTYGKDTDKDRPVVDPRDEVVYIKTRGQKGGLAGSKSALLKADISIPYPQGRTIIIAAFKSAKGTPSAIRIGNLEIPVRP